MPAFLALTIHPPQLQRESSEWWKTATPEQKAVRSEAQEAGIDAAFDASPPAQAIVRLCTSLTPCPMPSRYHPRWPLTCVRADGVWTH